MLVYSLGSMLVYSLGSMKKSNRITRTFQNFTWPLHAPALLPFLRLIHVIMYSYMESFFDGFMGGDKVKLLLAAHWIGTKSLTYPLNKTLPK